MKTGILAAVMFVALLGASIVIIELVRVPNMYEVEGIGEVKYRPDSAEIAVGFYAEAEASLDAVQQTAAAMRTTLAVVRAIGLKDADISSTSVRSDLVQDEDRNSTSPKKPLYYAYQSVLLKLNDLATIGKLLDEIARAGANYWLVTYKISDKRQKELSDAAHKAALADAMAKADAYATGGGFARGRILKIQDGSATFPDTDYYNREYRMSKGRSYASGNTRVEKVTVTGSRLVKDTTFDIPPPKEESVTASMEVLFEIR